MAAEDPGMDALRGSFGAFGSIIRARSARRMSQNSGRLPSHRRPYNREAALPPWPVGSSDADLRLHDTFDGLKRHQLYDAPVPRDDENLSVNTNVSPSPSGKRAAIKFDTQDVVYKYDMPGSGEKHTTERRVAAGSPSVGYPPLPSVSPRTDDLPPSSSHQNMDLIGITEEPAEQATGSGGVRDTNRYSLELPTSSRIKQENEVHSAPPTVHPRFAAMMSGTRHTLFNESPSTTSLLSFPSVTDSGPSENWEEDPEAFARRQKEWEVEREKMKEQERERERSGREREKGKERPRSQSRSRVGKRYPGASEDDDREESISLWDRSRVEDDDSAEGMSPLEPSPGGIRLVQPKRPDMF